MNKEKIKHLLIHALKIAAGSCIAIYIATALGLEYAASAGIIAMLSILTTKWETVKISLCRVITFFITVLLAVVTFQLIHIEWLEFGVFMFLLVIVCEVLGWKATISVNAVVGTHFLTTLDFSISFIINEFLLVFIGIAIAIFFNLFQNNGSAKKKIIQNMRDTEEKLQMIMEELAVYMRMENLDHSVWSDIIALEHDLAKYVDAAYRYQNNTFHSHPSYYIHYFEMRAQQCGVLHNLHYQMKKLRYMPKQAQIISSYISYMKDYIVELNIPSKQIEKLDEIFAEMKKEPLPKSREEFENRAILYHVLLDLEEFLVFKKRFVESLESIHKDIYWKES
ncbi:MAG: hypothetical protein EOM40_10920 [Clostridia bacterium]|nr:hypothetical protein [Clostridia bacterium]